MAPEAILNLACRHVTEGTEKNLNLNPPSELEGKHVPHDSPPTLLSTLMTLFYSPCHNGQRSPGYTQWEGYQLYGKVPELPRAYFTELPCCDFATRCTNSKTVWTPRTLWHCLRLPKRTM